VEIEGHPTQDLLDELKARGGVVCPGGQSGPDAQSLKFVARTQYDETGIWIFLPEHAFDTQIDEAPPAL